MIQQETMLDVADNSGVKSALCIKVLGRGDSRGRSTRPENNDYSWDEYWKTSDMAAAFGIFPDFSETRLYMGWRGFAFKGNPLLRYNSFLWDIWYQVGSRDKTFRDAISHAAIYESGNCEVYVNFSWVGSRNIFFNQ